MLNPIQIHYEGVIIMRRKKMLLLGLAGVLATTGLVALPAVDAAEALSTGTKGCGAQYGWMQGQITASTGQVLPPGSQYKYLLRTGSFNAIAQYHPTGGSKPGGGTWQVNATNNGYRSLVPYCSAAH